MSRLLSHKKRFYNTETIFLFLSLHISIGMRVSHFLNNNTNNNNNAIYKVPKALASEALAAGPSCKQASKHLYLPDQ